MTYQQPPRGPTYEAPDDDYEDYGDEPDRRVRMHPLAWVLPLFVGVAAFVAGGLVYGGHGKTVTQTVTVTTTPTQVVSTVQLITTVTGTPPKLDAFKDGVQLIGTDIPTGTFKTDGQTTTGLVCYYAILNSSDTSDIANNTIVTGPTRVVLPAGKYFETSGGCQWAMA